MKKVLMASLMMMGLVSLGYMTPSFAQEAAVAPAAPAEGVAQAATEEDKFSFGKVIAISEGKITVKEYDFTKDADVEAVYSVTAETEYGNVNALADLKEGDDIVIDYMEKDGARVVSTLVKEEKSMETMPGEGDAAAVPAAEGVTAPVVDAAAAVPEKM